MQARYYDPEAGRFLSVDPLGPHATNLFGFNRYAYANNNPVVNTDSDGRCPVCVAIPVFIELMAHSDYANAPGPNDPPVSLSTADHLSAVAQALPPGRAASLVKIGVKVENVSHKTADTSRMSVQQQTMDRSHEGEPHWEAGKVRVDKETKEVQMSKYGWPKLDNNKSKVGY